VLERLSKEGEEIGHSGGVSRFVYVTSVVVMTGQCLKDLRGDLMPSLTKIEVGWVEVRGYVAQLRSC